MLSFENKAKKKKKCCVALSDRPYDQEMKGSQKK